MNEIDERPFSKVWMFASMGIFISAELLLGGVVGEVLLGKFLSLNLRFLLQGVLNLVSFFCGGFVVGVISPGVRTKEPAVGAFLSVALVLCFSLFTPYSFIQFSLTKMLIGGGAAFCLALIGARLGEKVFGNIE